MTSQNFTSHWRLLLTSIGFTAAALAGGCATTGPKPIPFDQMTAAQHRQAAAEYNERADQSFEEVKPNEISPGNTIPAQEGPSMTAPFNYSSEPGYPGYYTLDPRPLNPTADHVEDARDYRSDAVRHQAAAEELDQRRRQ